jgi:membrane fusion protein (multidrug efflux system)
VVVVDKESKAEVRGVELGPWHGQDWFITAGLNAGDTVVVDGMVRLSPGVPVKVIEAAAKQPAGEPAPAAGDASSKR